MEMRTYIEMGEKKAGKQKELAKVLGITENFIRVAKSGKNGLPDAICFRLADYLNADVGAIIAASNLVTEKKEERRKVFEDYLKKSGENAAKMMIGALVISLLTLSPLESTQAQTPEKARHCILC